MRTGPVAIALLLAGCGSMEEPGGLDPARGEPLVAAQPALSCSSGLARARTGAGDAALCTLPQLLCDPSTELLSGVQCHLAPSESAAGACCAPLPTDCAQADCECLLAKGPWVDDFILRAQGSSLAAYAGPKWKCSYRVSCTPATGSAAAQLVCTPA
jgi:hypothetical protein